MLNQISDGLLHVDDMRTTLLNVPEPENDIMQTCLHVEAYNCFVLNIQEKIDDE